MTPAERAQQVRRWYETMVEFERQCAAFSDLTMAHPESPFVLTPVSPRSKRSWRGRTKLCAG